MKIRNSFGWYQLLMVVDLPAQFILGISSTVTIQQTLFSWGSISTNLRRLGLYRQRLSLHSSSQSSTYHKEDSTNMNGLRCKRFLLSNGVGETAPPVYCFCGLTDEEMIYLELPPTYHTSTLLFPSSDHQIITIITIIGDSIHKCQCRDMKRHSDIWHQWLCN